MVRFFCAVLFSTASLCGASQQLVLRGDYPDPSVVKIGDTYWASATTSNWMPAYPILQSKDLVNWKTVTHVFPKLPEWADYYFWAPEITYENGKVYVYYAAHKKGGNLCIAVASADRPEGPYTDHGPLMCQEVGSIDAFPMRDEKGKLYMIWKEDANSVNKPTPIWAQEMNEQRTALIGEKKELFRNEAAWEGNLVEGVSMIRKNDYYYAIYAASACCGAACTYGVGVARSRSLLGPWEKYSGNPVLANTSQWTCPGHGTPVEKDGRYYFMYHAYDKASNVFTGRQGLLIEYKFTPDGWIAFEQQTPGAVAVQNASTNFRGRRLGENWQWSVFQQPQFEMRRGELRLHAQPSPSGSFLGHKIVTGNYTANVKVHSRKSDVPAGLSVIGDEENTVTLWYNKGALQLVRLRGGKDSVLAIAAVDDERKVHLRVQVRNGSQLQFYVSTDGATFRQVGDRPVDGSFLPPWDRAVRVGVAAKGERDRKAVFDQFELINE